MKIGELAIFTIMEQDTIIVRVEREIQPASWIV